MAGPGDPDNPGSSFYNPQTGTTSGLTPFQGKDGKTYYYNPFDPRNDSTSPYYDPVVFVKNGDGSYTIAGAGGSTTTNPTNPNSPGGTGGSGGGGAGGPTIFGLSQGERDSLMHSYWQIGQHYHDVLSWLGHPDGISAGMVQTLLDGATDPGEFQARLDAARAVMDNQTYYDQAEIAARREGILKPGEKFGKAERLKVYLGTGGAKFYDFLRESTARAYAAEAGFTFGSGRADLALKGNDITALLSHFPGFTDIGQLKSALANAAQNANLVLSGARKEGLGLSDEDFLNYFAGTASEGAASKVAKILANNDAFQKQPLPSTLQQTQTGTTVAGLSQAGTKSL